MIRPVVSVCIVHWNTPSDLTTCLEALAKNAPVAPIEVLVIDNASAPGSVDFLATDYPDVRCIHNSSNRGYAAGCNLAASKAVGDIFLFLNPDARVTEGAIDTLVGLTQDVPFSVAVPRLVWPSGATQQSITGFPNPTVTLLEMLRLTRWIPYLDTWKQRLFDYEIAQVCDQPMASCWLIPRAAWEAVGPMDQQFPLYFNDVDWAIRLKETQWRFYYTPSAIVIHDHGGTTQKIGSVAVWESRRSFALFWKKHYTRQPLRGLATFLLWVEACSRTKTIKLGWKGATLKFDTDTIEHV